MTRLIFVSDKRSNFQDHKYSPPYCPILGPYSKRPTISPNHAANHHVHHPGLYFHHHAHMHTLSRRMAL